MTSVSLEHERRQSNRDAVANYFKERPGEWIDAADLMKLGSIYAWRTRVSNCRVELGMNIENKQERDTIGGAVTIRSLYRYLPYVPVGDPADEYREVTLFNLSDRQERR